MLFTFLGGIFDGYCNFLKWLVKMATKRFIFDLGSVYYTQRGLCMLQVLLSTLGSMFLSALSTPGE